MSNEVATMPNIVNTDTGSLVLAPERMNDIIKFAEFMATAGPMLPAHLQKKPADCMAITLQAMQWGMSPFSVAQKTHLVNGTLGYEAQLVNAVVSSSRAIEGRFHYEYGGDWGLNDGKSTDQMRFVRVGAVLRGEKEIQWGEPLYPARVTTKNSPLWKTNEKQQTSYLGLKYWSRLYTPAVIMGVYDADEIREMEPRDVTPTPKTLDLKALQGGKTDDDDGGVIDAEFDEELNKVLEAIGSAKNKGALAKAAEKAKLLSEENQLKARPAYQKRLNELKKSEKDADAVEAETTPANSKAFDTMAKLIDMANTEADIEAVVNMPHWSDLSKGEAPKLQELITAQREGFDGGAAGVFGG